MSDKNKPYRFILHGREQRDPLRLEIDCLNDMEASILALGLVSREHAVDVWIDGALIYGAPAIGQLNVTTDAPRQEQAELGAMIDHVGRGNDQPALAVG